MLAFLDTSEQLGMAGEEIDRGRGRAGMSFPGENTRYSLSFTCIPEMAGFLMIYTPLFNSIYLFIYLYLFLQNKTKQEFI